MDRGLRASQSQRWVQAKQVFSKLLESRPQYTPAHLYRGEALFRLGYPRKALKNLERAAQDRTLDAPSRHKAHYLKGRALVEIGRLEYSDTQFRHRTAYSAARRKTQEYFLAANVAFHNATKIRKDSYEVVLWRAYSLHRQENFRKALDLLRACERRKPRHWHHKFFRALALDGLHGPNTRSVEIVLGLAEGPPRPEQLDLYIYLLDIYEEVPLVAAEKIPPLIANFRRVSGVRSPEIDSFMEKLEKKREKDRRDIVLEQSLTHAQKLARSEKFLDALRLLKNYEAMEGQTAQVTSSINNLISRWSKLLDLQAQNHLRAVDRDKLREILEEYKIARKMTDKLEIKITLQQRINDLQLALTHLTSSSKVREIAGLLKAGDYKEVLLQLKTVRLSHLQPPDREFRDYIEGVAHYRLDHWKAAVRALRKVRNRTYEDLDLLHGLALVKGGDRSAGLAMVAKLPPQPGNDEVNLLLAEYFAEDGKHVKALSYLDSVRNPPVGGLELAVRLRTEIGINKYNHGDFRRAVSELQAARKILDEKLHKPGADVYTYLGNAYFRLEAFGKAKRVFEALINSNLTTEERTRSREAFLNLSRIHLRDKRDDLAYQDIKEFLSLGGQVPADLKNEYGRLAATFADFMPLDRVDYWNYASTTRDYNYSVIVREKISGSYRVERREAGRSHSEMWKRRGILLVKHTGKDGAVALRIPVNLNPVEKMLPFVEYTTGPGNRLRYTSEVVAINRTVKLPDGQQFHGCLRVRVTRTVAQRTGRESRTRYVIYLAPGVGEVKQEIFQDEKKVAETVLTRIVFKDEGAKE